MDQINLPPWRRGDSFGPVRIGPVNPLTPLPYPLAEAEMQGIAGDVALLVTEQGVMGIYEEGD